MKRVIANNIARLMSPEDRKKHGIETAEESAAKEAYQKEKAEHGIYIDWCRINEIPCRTDRMDKRVTGTVGWPDMLVVYGGRVLPLEFKVFGNKLSPQQLAVKIQLEETGTEVLVCFSADEAIRKTKSWLWTNFAWEPKSI